jgi:hypothetical protein
MKINLSEINQEQFWVNEHIVAGESMYLVVPKQIGAEWTATNLHLRSSLWTADGKLVSASFKKFFNMSEKPGLYPNPDKFEDWVVTEKVDGSTLIVSKYKGQLIVRTRGTVDASKLELSGHEIADLIKKYPRVFDFGGVETADYSLLFEWVTPKNQIIIKYDESDIILIGGIYHESYSLMPQRHLNGLAENLGVRRPRVFKFNSLAEMVDTVSKFSDMEGVCLYYNEDQNIVKIKGLFYLKLHKMKSQLGSLTRVLELYLQQVPYKTEQEFFDFIVDTFDFELATQCAGHIKSIAQAYVDIGLTVAELKKFKVATLDPIIQKKGMLGRKDCATAIFKDNKESAPILFKLLDGVDVLTEPSSVQKLMYKQLDLK